MRDGELISGRSVMATVRLLYAAVLLSELFQCYKALKRFISAS